MARRPAPRKKRRDLPAEAEQAAEKAAGAAKRAAKKTTAPRKKAED